MRKAALVGAAFALGDVVDLADGIDGWWDGYLELLSG
jgi:hypothetical protein